MQTAIREIGDVAIVDVDAVKEAHLARRQLRIPKFPPIWFLHPVAGRL
jgi:hypothetical protein